MAVVTKAEVKTLLGITSTGYDSKITALIPHVQNDILDYCNNYFCDSAIYIEREAGLAFVGGTSAGASRDYITDDNQDFTSAGFADGMDVAIVGGSNSGMNTISSVTTGTMKMISTGDFVDQDQDTSYNHVGPILISRVQWPRGIKKIAAQMVWHLIDDPKPKDVKSESIDDYSVTYAGDNEYPKRVIQGLNKYRRVEMI